MLMITMYRSRIVDELEFKIILFNEKIQAFPLVSKNIFVL